MAINKMHRLSSLIVFFVFLVPLCGAATRVGDFLQPKTVEEFIWSDENSEFYRIRILTSTVISVDPSACQFLQLGTIIDRIRGDAIGNIEICSDQPHRVGTEFLLALYPAKFIPAEMQSKIDTASKAARFAAERRYIQKSVWKYRIYSLGDAITGTRDYVVISKTHIVVPASCIGKVERRVFEFDDENIESEYYMQHIDWKCLLNVVRSQVPEQS